MSVHPDEVRAYERAKFFRQARRMDLAKTGEAMPDGSFPILGAGDLHNAVVTLGLAKDKSGAKAHIVKRARSLGLTAKLPASWGAGDKSGDNK